MARENRGWGYSAPERGKRTTWSQFLKAHWSVLAAADFFTVEVWGPRGLVTFYVFFVIELATRRIDIAGITPSPNEPWMMQIGRNLTDPRDGPRPHRRSAQFLDSTGFIGPSYQVPFSSSSFPHR